MIVNRVWSVLSFGLVCMVWFSSCEKIHPSPASQDVVFSKFYGGGGNQTGKSVMQLTDSTFLLLGTSNSFGAGDFDVYLVEVDSQGNEIWENTYGGLTDDEGVVIKAIPAGGFIIGSNLTNSAGLSKIMLTKIDDTGAIIWQNEVRDTPNKEDWISDLEVVPAGGFIVVGTTTQVDVGKNLYNAATDLKDIFTVRVSDSGTFLWQNAYGFPFEDFGAKVELLTDSTFWVLGTVNKAATNSAQPIIINYNHIGVPINPVSDFSNQSNILAIDFLKQASGNLLVMCNTSFSTLGGSNEIVLMDVDENLDLVSSSSIVVSGYNEAVSIQHIENEDYIISATELLPNDIDSYAKLIKASFSGTVYWEASFGRFYGNTAGEAIPISSGGFMLTGGFDLETNIMMGLIKTNANGTLIAE